MLKRISLIFVLALLLTSIIGCANQEPNSDNQADKIIFESDKEKEMVSCSIKKEIISCSRVLYVDNLGEVITILKMRVTEDKLVFLNAIIELETEVTSKKANVSSQGSSDNKTNNVLNVEIENVIQKDDIVYLIEQTYQFSKNTISIDTYTPSIISSSPFIPEPTIAPHNYDYNSYFREISKDFTFSTSDDYLQLDIFKRLYSVPPHCKEIKSIRYDIHTKMEVCLTLLDEIANPLWNVSNFVPEKDSIVERNTTSWGYNLDDTKIVDAQELIDKMNEYNYIYIPTFYHFYNTDIENPEYKYLESEGFMYTVYLDNNEIKRYYRFTYYEEIDTTIISVTDYYDSNTDSGVNHLVFAVATKK